MEPPRRRGVAVRPTPCPHCGCAIPMPVELAQWGDYVICGACAGVLKVGAPGVLAPVTVADLDEEPAEVVIGLTRARLAVIAVLTERGVPDDEGRQN